MSIYCHPFRPSVKTAPFSNVAIMQMHVFCTKKLGMYNTADKEEFDNETQCAALSKTAARLAP